MLFHSVEELNAAIRVDAPEAKRPIDELPCEGALATCANWLEYRAANATWYATLVGGRLVSTRETTFGDMRERSLERATVGNFVFSMLSTRDDSCPGKPADHCYKDWNTDEELPPDAPRFCESDIRVRCTEDGVTGYIEVLSLANDIVYKFEEVRHLKRYRSSASAGRLKLELDDCVLEL